MTFPLSPPSARLNSPTCYSWGSLGLIFPGKPLYLPPNPPTPSHPDNINNKNYWSDAYYVLFACLPHFTITTTVRGSYYAHFRGQANWGFQRFGNLPKVTSLFKEKSLIQNPLALKPNRSVRPWYCSTSGIWQEGEENFYSNPHLVPVAPFFLKLDIRSPWEPAATGSIQWSDC